MGDLYEFTVEWPSTSAKSVIVTGDFDQWSKSLHLSKSADTNLFTASIKVPYGCPTQYKFIVDGEWTIQPEKPTEYSPQGYLNNVYYVPLKAPLVPKPPANGAVGSLNGGVDRLLGMTDLKDTIVASTGTSGALAYVASGFGGTVRNIVGVDPINSNQIAIPTPISPSSSIGFPSTAADPPPRTDDATNTNPELNPRTIDDASSDPVNASSESISIAPLVPITIVPVYAKENCTIDPKKVVSDEENIGTFVGIHPTSRVDDKEEVKENGRKVDDGQGASVSLPSIPDIVTSSPVPEELAVPSAADASVEEEEFMGGATVLVGDKAKSSSVSNLERVAAPPPLVQGTTLIQAPEKTPEKIGDPPAPAPAPGPVSEPTQSSAVKLSTSGHTQEPSSASTKGTSSLPTPSAAPATSSESVKSTSTSTIRKSGIFSQSGKGSSTRLGNGDEFGVQNGKGTSGRKKRSSFFGSLRKLFHHDHHEKDKEKKGVQ